MKLVQDNVLLEPVKNNNMNDVGTLYIPATAEQPRYTARVVLIGPGTEKSPVPEALTIGCKVIYRPGSDRFLEGTHDERFLVRISDIWAVIKD